MSLFWGHALCRWKGVFRWEIWIVSYTYIISHHFFTYHFRPEHSDFYSLAYNMVRKRWKSESVTVVYVYGPFVFQLQQFALGLLDMRTQVFVRLHWPFIESTFEHIAKWWPVCHSFQQKCQVLNNPRLHMQMHVKRKAPRIPLYIFRQKGNYCILKSCCTISVLFSTKCHLFHNFISFCLNDTFFINHVLKFKY